MMDGLVVAIDMLMRHCGKKKYKKRIFLITDGEKEAKYDKNELKQIISNMNESDVRLNVITLGFCDDLEEDEDEEEGDEDDEKDNRNGN